MRVSIVVDNYNYASFLPYAVDSALGQDWPDTEVIVVDDGSTDDSARVMQHYQNRATLLHKPNGGQASALNFACEHVTGAIVIFLDADDVLERSTARAVVAAFRSGPPVARVQWPLATIDASGQRTGNVAPTPVMMPSGDLRRHVVRFRTHVWPAQSGNAYATWALRELLPFPTENSVPSDLYLAETTALLGNVVSLHEVGGEYRVHGQNFYADQEFDPEHIRKKMRWTRITHQHVHRVAQRHHIDCPIDERTALDIAFVCQRLASLRLDPRSHPYSDETRLGLLIFGLRAALVHPHHTRQHKLKRVAWVTVVALGTRKMAERAIRRFYFSSAK